MERLFIFLFITLFVYSCVDKKTTNKTPASQSTDTVNTGSGSNTGSGDNTGSTDNGSGNHTVDSSCNAPGFGSGSSDYYRISAVFKGKGGQGLNWSTLTAPSFANDNQNLLITDSRFNVRVVVRPSPGGGPGSSLCPNMAIDYTKLSFRVGLKTSSSAPGYITPNGSRSFSNIQIDQCTPVIEFPTPSVNNPLVLDIYDVQWDACVNGPGTCNVDYVWHNDCVEIEVQIATDHTKDIDH